MEKSQTQTDLGESDSQTSKNIEIYKQKYENFRHFDRLRWQAPGIAFAIAAGVVAFSAREGTSPWVRSVLLIVLGILICLCAFTMRRIGVQLEVNTQVLDAAAKLIGDETIPKPQRHGATWFFQLFLSIVGSGCLVAGIVVFAKALIYG